MALPDWRDELPGKVRAMQVIVAAMVLGCLVFAGVACIVSLTRAADKDQELLITYIALGVAVLSLFPRMIVPTIMVSAGRKKILEQLRRKTSGTDSRTAPNRFDAWENETVGQLTALLLGKLIISVALMEGATFFLLVAYLLERSPICLLVAAFMIILLALHFPTISRSTSWLEDQWRLLNEEA
jgi:hypothetical protein